MGKVLHAHTSTAIGSSPTVRNVDGAHIALFCWVEQIMEDPESGYCPLGGTSALKFRQGLHSLYVCFSDNALVGLPPHVLRLLPDAPGEC